jgi:hypothetical protein
MSCDFDGILSYVKVHEAGEGQVVGERIDFWSLGLKDRLN